jgi:hypothetical protein
MITCPTPDCTHEDHMEEYMEAVSRAAEAADIETEDLLRFINEVSKPPKEVWTVVPNRADRRRKRR